MVIYKKKLCYAQGFLRYFRDSIWSLELKIGSLESEKVIIGYLESEKIGTLASEKSGPCRSIPGT